MFLYVLDLFGVAVFAVSGALVGGRKRMDLFGVLVVAGVTAIGGGTLRDLLLGRLPVFWVRDPVYFLVIGAAALATIAYTRVRPLPRLSLQVADAFGLAFFAISGARLAEEVAAAAHVVVLMGTMTGVAGGVIRDVLTARIPLVLRTDIYATAAVAGCSLYVILARLAVPANGAAIAGMVAIFALRLAAIVWGLSLPQVRPYEGEEG